MIDSDVMVQYHTTLMGVGFGLSTSPYQYAYVVHRPLVQGVIGLRGRVRVIRVLQLKQLGVNTICMRYLVF